jgi:hypothetical protein
LHIFKCEQECIICFLYFSIVNSNLFIEKQGLIFFCIFGFCRIKFCMWQSLYSKTQTLILSGMHFILALA